MSGAQVRWPAPARIKQARTQPNTRVDGRAIPARTVSSSPTRTVISTDTGRILGSETIYLGDDPEFPIPTGSVMSYQMWDLGADAR